MMFECSPKAYSIKQLFGSILALPAPLQPLLCVAALREATITSEYAVEPNIGITVRIIAC
jgi:hypothetical protein